MRILVGYGAWKAPVEFLSPLNLSSTPRVARFNSVKFIFVAFVKIKCGQDYLEL